MLTAEQLRAARAILRWEQKTLASTANVSVETIKRLEKMEGPLMAVTMSTVSAIRTALEQAGVQFLDHEGVAGGPGVALRR